MIIHDGTAQNHRHPNPLKPGYFNVAEMDLQHLLAYGMDYAQVVRYYNPANQQAGDWSFLFSGDDTMVLAHICATNMARIESDFQDACNQPAHLRPSAAVCQASHTYQLAVRLNTWYTWLASATSKPGICVRDLISDAINKQLGRYLRGLQMLLVQYPSRLLDHYRIDFGTFAPIWRIGLSLGPQDTITDDDPSAKRGTVDVDKMLQSSFNAFHNATALVIRTATENFSLSMARRDHEPAVALYIAFVQLFLQAQEKINQFTTQHMKYYYHDILQIEPCEPLPDTTYLIVMPDGALPQVAIPKGTAFTAGKDADGNIVTYCADNDLWVTDTRVTRLNTLYFEKNRLMSPEMELDYITDAWVATLPPLHPDRQATHDAKNHAPEALFGGPAAQAVLSSGAPANFGLAVADPILLLSQGQRNITLTIDVDEADTNLLTDIIQRIKNWSGTTVQAAFFKIFKRMFTIHLTTDAGWYEIENYLPEVALINPALPGNSLCLHIQLAAQEPAVVPYHPDLHGVGYEQGLPVIRLNINPQNDLYPYSLLQTLTLKEIRIHVSVNGYKDLQVYNQHGQLDPTAPFHPFGPLPGEGSYLMVGAYETALKNLTALEVGLEWDTLPGGRHGMAAHYRGYDHPYRPELYELRATLLSDGRWYPKQEKEQPLIKLFQSPGKGKNASSDISAHCVLKAQHLAQHIPAATTSMEKTDFGFDLNARCGFFKFTLVHPEYGFGHKAYPQLLSRALTSNALKKKFSPLPNEPYTPTVKSISINYRAESDINMEKGMAAKGTDALKRLYHLHPLGWERIYPPIDNRPRPIVPDHDHAGNLFIGLSGSKPAGPLTLFFHLQPRADRHTDLPGTAAKWYYLSSNHWIELSARRIISDSTNGFIHSGIITLDLPEQLDRNNTIMPNDSYWLRVGLDRDCDTNARLLGVAAQALPVTRVLPDEFRTDLQTSLPAGTITQAQTALPGIGKVFQPVASMNGRTGETEQRLTTRVSERLRHKNRAITAWDYERLVLEQFPDIYKVKCFASTERASHTPSSGPYGGKVLIVVIAQPDAGAQNPEQHPMADTRLLKRIHDHVAALCSPFATIEVCNPTYEKIQIRCSIKLHPSVGAGAALKRINNAISRYLSPWSGQNRYQARFGWCIRRADIESYLLKLEDVEFVTRFSMLHIVRHADDRYSLFDTAGKIQTSRHTEDIHPRFPWSIAVPTRNHQIHTMNDYQPITSQSAGINDIAIGETFIISGT